MPRCRVRQGFFVLSDCTRNAASSCPACQRPVCADHFVEDADRCADCYGKADTDLAAEDAHFAYQARARMYREYAYRPVYWGRYRHDTYYSEFEMRDFEGASAYMGDGLANGGDLDDAGDFYDS